MKVETLQTQESLAFGPIQLLYRRKPAKASSGVSWSLGGDMNNCVKLQVACPQGRLEAEGKIMVGGHTIQQFSELKDITFVPLRSQYAVTSPEPSAYWAMPLANFVSEFFQWHPDLNRHPLRIYPTPEIPPVLSEIELFRANLETAKKNRLIVFEFNGKLGFIEPLPDYDEKKSKLEDGAEKSLITCLMVGHAPSDPVGWSDLATWFPFKLLDLLSLATGTEVGAPWVEFRDQRGTLVRRFHASMGRHNFVEGHRVIHEGPHRGTGLLLTRSLGSPQFGKTYLHVAIKHLVRGGMHEGAYLEDRFNHVARGLDSVAKQSGVDHVNLLERLPVPLAAAVLEALDSASKAVRRHAENSASEGHHDDQKVLERIAARLESGIITNAWDFGQAVTKLLAYFNFPDAEIVESYYSRTPHLGGRTWAKALSQCRARVMHGSSFNFDTDAHGLRDILAILNHLHDILVRMILITLGYEGSYQPTPMTWVASNASTKWVKSETSAQDLGYKGLSV